MTEAYSLFWGDSHMNLHPDQMDLVDEGFEEARRRLDFYPIAYYPFVRDDVKGLKIESVRQKARFVEDWKVVLDAVKRHNTPGEFVTFPGYEWHGNRRRWGDHNVYYPGDGGELLATWELPDLFKELSRAGAIAVPHHIAYQPGERGKDWSFHDPEVSPVAEIFSGHGCSERPWGLPLMERNFNMGPRTGGGSATGGLARGHRFGFTASGDNHGGYPGVWGRGLMGVWAEERTRRSIWQAIRARRTCGVTGDRIRLWFECNGSPMGSELRAEREVHLKYRARGSYELDRAELVRDGKTVDEHALADRWPEPSAKTLWKLRVRCGWGPSRGAGYYLGERKWNCTLRAPGVAGVEGCFTTAGQRIEASSGREARWTLRFPQRGDRLYGDAGQAVVVEFEAAPGDEVHLRANEFELRARLEDLLRGPVILSSDENAHAAARAAFGIGPGDVANADIFWHNRDKVLVSRAIPEAAYAAEGEFTDAPPAGEHYYYLRVRQVNGQVAWSSPVWVTARPQTC